jgi:muramoyltetrapeptide carboxypeptidase
MALTIPPYLTDGDRLAIVSPSGIVEKDVIQKAVKMLNNSGFEVTLGENVFNKSGCFAGNDRERLHNR